MPGWIGPWEIIIVVVIILIVFGGRLLPRLGRSLGGSVVGLKKGLKEGEEGFKTAIKEDDPKVDADAPPSPAPTRRPRAPTRTSRPDGSSVVADALPATVREVEATTAERGGAVAEQQAGSAARDMVGRLERAINDRDLEGLVRTLPRRRRRGVPRSSLAYLPGKRSDLAQLGPHHGQAGRLPGNGRSFRRAMTAARGWSGCGKAPRPMARPATWRASSSTSWMATRSPRPLLSGACRQVAFRPRGRYSFVGELEPRGVSARHRPGKPDTSPMVCLEGVLVNRSDSVSCVRQVTGLDQRSPYPRPCSS